MAAVSEAAIESIAGTTGSIISLLATYPLLTISTVQTLKHTKKTDDHPKQAGSLQMLRDALEAHQLRSGKLQAAGLDARQQDIGVVASLAVAAASGCINVLLTNPVWVVVTQMQAQNSRKRAPGSPRRQLGAWGIAKELQAEKGIAWLWQGVAPGLVMVANPTVQYMLYEWLLARLAALRRGTGAGAPGAKVKLGWLDVFLLGALAKLGSTLLTYPMLLVKNRMQARNQHTAAEMRYSSVLDALRRIWKQEGLWGFYQGINTKMSQTVLAAALLLAIREQVYGATKLLVTAIPR